MAYSEKVLDHYENPRNVGVIEEDQSVGTGMVGAPACGDVRKLQIKVGDDGIIQDAKFKTYGCGSAIASSSLVTEWIKGKSLDEAGEIKRQRTVLFKPMLGIIDQDKLIPLRYAPLQFEFELVSSSGDSVFIGPSRENTCSANWGISDIQCKMDLSTLDSSLQNEYASHLLSGKSLPINFSSYNYSSQSTNGDKDFSAHIHRALTRLKSVYITLFNNWAGTGVGPAEVKAPANCRIHVFQEIGTSNHPAFIVIKLAQHLCNFRNFPTTLGSTTV